MKLSTSTRKKFRITNKLKKVSKPGRFRLSIFRSSKNISAQIIDDSKNITLLSASSVEKETPSSVARESINVLRSSRLKSIKLPSLAETNIF